MSTFNLSQAIRAQMPLQEIDDHLNALAHEDRVRQSRGLGPADQRALWMLCKDAPADLDAIVPPSLPPRTPVRHLGRNTLPVFKMFEKRFYKPSPESDTLWGYNEGPTRGLVGPGYFVCYATQGDHATERGAVVIDYEQVPPQAPEGWPALKVNEAGVSRLVYGYMHDFLRRVSDHVTIGRAYKKGKDTPNYFTLCRLDEAP